MSSSVKEEESRLSGAELANHYFQKARAAAAKVENDYQRSQAFAEIATATRESSDWSHAHDAAAKIVDDYERSRVFTKMAIAIQNLSS